MKLRIGQDIDVALDCVRPVGPCHLFVQGWIAWPDDRQPPDLHLLSHGLPLGGLLDLRHDRPDLAGAAGAGRAMRGFILVAGRPDGPRGTAGFAIASGPLALALPAEGLGAPVAEVLARLPWDAGFAALDAATRDEVLGTLLTPGDAFARWVAALPRLDAAGPGQHGLARVDAIAAPAGECALSVALPRPLAPGESLRAVALLAEPDGPRALPLDGPPPLRREDALTLYGRLPALPDLTAPRFDLLVELRRPGGGTWFRTTPRLHPAPDFLRLLRDVGAAGEPAEGFAWLRGVLEARRAAFDAAFAAPRAPAGPPSAGAPVVAVLHAVDDPFAARLIFLAAPEIERRAAEVLVLGPRVAAAAAADVFLQRGRVPARSGLDLAAAARRGTYASAALVPVDPAALAAALEAGTLDRIFTRRIGGAALAPLLRLAAAAGTLDGAEAFGRLAQLVEDWQEGRETRIPAAGAPGATGHLIAEHLAALWRGAAPALAAATA